MDIFLICFLTGLGILLFNMIFGSLSDFFSVDLDLDFDTNLHGDHMGHGILGFLSPSTLSGFLVAFGGMGMFFRYLAFPLLLVWPMAIVSGGFAGWLLMKLMRFLKKHENGSAADHEDLVGLPAQVVNAIQEGGGYGSIRYVFNGNTFTSPAVSYDGTAIPQGAAVAIVSIEKHLYYVSEINLEE